MKPLSGMTCFLLHKTPSLTTTLSRRVILRSSPRCALQLRYYANERPGAAFDSNKWPNPEQAFAAGKAQTKRQPQFEANVESPPRKYGFTPGRLILVSVLAYFSYSIYNWQINPHRSIFINEKYFTPFILDSRDRVSSSSSIFSFLSVPPGQNMSNVADSWKLGVWSIQVIQTDSQIARSYTPLPPNPQSPAEQLRLLVRHEPQGEVSGYLHKRPPGSLVGLRGPFPEYFIPEDVDEVVFLAGGTGIAPALQVAHCLYTARELPPERTPKMNILWANRRLEDSYAGSKPSPVERIRASVMAKVRAGLDLDSAEKAPGKVAEGELSRELSEQSPLVQELEALKDRHSDKLTIDYFVDEENTFITERLLQKRLSRQNTKSSQGSGSVSKKLLLVSGPEGFVTAFAGPKGMYRGKEIQGPLGGILGNMDLGAWEVWKL